MKLQLQFGSKTIHYNLSYSGRKTLGITVTSDMETEVRAPFGIPVEKIEEKVLKKAPWIIKQQNYFLLFHPKTPQKKYLGGETHLYLGRQYRLKIINDKTDKVALKAKFIEVTTSDKSKVKKLLDQWYLQKAEIKFKALSGELIERFKKYNVEPASIVIREMPARWGSCTKAGKILLNPELIKAPKACIEYVIIHELCHLVYHDHTQKFSDLQSKEMPDWEKWKTRLEKLLA